MRRLKKISKKFSKKYDFRRSNAIPCKVPIMALHGIFLIKRYLRQICYVFIGKRGVKYTMDDNNIIELYWQRDQSAVKESQKKYGAYCNTIAVNILNSAEDSEECVNDTWLRAWNAIPPEKPERLRVFLGRITRNLAIDKYRKRRAEKNGGGQIAVCLDELGECIGEDSPIEDRVALRELINSFLIALTDKNRDVFLLRYWYMMPIQKIAERHGISEGAVKMILQRVRNKLKEHLEREGVGI